MAVQYMGYINVTESDILRLDAASGVCVSRTVYSLKAP